MLRSCYVNFTPPYLQSVFNVDKGWYKIKNVFLFSGVNWTFFPDRDLALFGCSEDCSILPSHIQTALLMDMVLLKKTYSYRRTPTPTCLCVHCVCVQFILSNLFFTWSHCLWNLVTKTIFTTEKESKSVKYLISSYQQLAV